MNLVIVNFYLNPPFKSILWVNKIIRYSRKENNQNMTFRKKNEKNDIMYIPFFPTTNRLTIIILCWVLNRIIITLYHTDICTYNTYVA